MDHQNFAVSAALDTPLILNPRAFLTLDALIGALIFERTQDAALAMRAVPLAETNGIRHGSAAFLKGDVRSAPRGTAVFRSGLAPREASEPRFVWPSRKFKGRREYTAINPKAGAYRNTLDAYEALEAGAGFVLVNDHDPKPLRYQFEAEHAGEHTWDYLQNGPRVWQVRIGRAPGAQV